jgi:HSP20 family molecular chaperone IbpA
MNTNKDVTQTQNKDVAQRQNPEGRASDYVLPQVDVYENTSGITLMADLPGVSGDRLNLQVDKDTLLIEAEASLDIPEGVKALYAEFRHPRYRRSFALSSELDAEAVEANLRDGVLTLHLPKKAPYQPRKIEVQTS